MDISSIFIVGGIVVVSLLILAGFFYIGYAIHERFFLDPEERWRRRYDRRLKKHFKSLSGL